MESRHYSAFGASQQPSDVADPLGYVRFRRATVERLLARMREGEDEYGLADQGEGTAAERWVAAQRYRLER